MLKSNVEARVYAIEGSLQALHQEIAGGRSEDLTRKSARREDATSVDTEMGRSAAPMAAASGGRLDARCAYRAASAEPRHSSGDGSEELRGIVVGIPEVIGQRTLRGHPDAIMRLVPDARQPEVRVACPKADDKFFLYSLNL